MTRKFTDPATYPLNSDPLDDISVTAEELKAELSERGLMEFEIASLRVTNRKLIARLQAVLDAK